jgi:hypothetical protein
MSGGPNKSAETLAPAAPQHHALYRDCAPPRLGLHAALTLVLPDTEIVLPFHDANAHDTFGPRANTNCSSTCYGPGRSIRLTAFAALLSSSVTSTVLQRG